MKDLTKIKTPFGLLGKKTRKGLREHHDVGGVIEVFAGGEWSECDPKWNDDVAYRVKPQVLTVDPSLGVMPKYVGPTSWHSAIPWNHGVKPRSVRDEMEAPHPIFAAVKEWQEARKAALEDWNLNPVSNSEESYDVRTRLSAADKALMSTVVPS